MADEQKTIEAPSSPELGYPIPSGIYAAESSPLIQGTSTENQKVAEDGQDTGEKPAAKTTTTARKS